MEVNELEPAPVEDRVAPEGTPDKQSVREAAKILAGLRHKKDEAVTPPEPVEIQNPEFSAEENDAPPPIEEPSVEPEAPEPVPEEPPLEAPRSWTRSSTGTTPSTEACAG